MTKTFENLQALNVMSKQCTVYKSTKFHFFMVLDK